MAKLERLRVRRVSVDRLHESQIEEMWKLYETFYKNADRNRFRRDLERKDCVFLGIGRDSQRVLAFSTARFYTVRHNGREVGVYFSGDTMVDPRYWGRHVLQRRVVPALLAWRLRHPLRRMYWHLTCNGYRTLLTLANSCTEYWPHPFRLLPDWEAGLIDRISQDQFGSAWSADDGVVRDDARLKEGVAPFTAEVRAIPVVDFFLRRNPGFSRGEELSMVGRVNLGFFLRACRKLLRMFPRFHRTRGRSRSPTGASHPISTAPSRSTAAFSAFELRAD